MEILGKGLRSRWVGVLSLIALAIGAAIFVYKGLPWGLGLLVARSLRSHEVELASFPIESVGLTRSRVTHGELTFREQAFAWGSLDVRYSLADLWSGKVGQVSMERPRLHFVLPTEKTSPNLPVIPPPGVLPEPVPSREPLVETDSTRQPVASGEKPARKSFPHPVAQDNFYRVPEYPDLVHFFESLPFSKLSATDGTFDFSLHDQMAIVGIWDALLVNGPDLLSGRIFFDAERLSLYSTVSGVKSARAVSLHSELNLAPDLFGDIMRLIPGRAGEFLGNSTIPEPLTADILVDWAGPGLPGMSAESKLESIQFAPWPGLLIEANSLLALGTFKDGELRVNAGLKFNRFSTGEVSVSAFSVRGSYGPDERLRIESERFTIQADQWTGQFAFRGNGIPGGLALPFSGQLELAFTTVSGPYFEIEPASLLFRIGENYSALASPLGLKRKTTLWVEDLNMDYDSSSGGLSGGFSWFNSVGAKMGMVHLLVPAFAIGDINPDYRMEDAEGNPFLGGTVAVREGDLDWTVEGRLLLSWVNALNKWAGWSPASLSGDDPQVRLSIANIKTFPKGNVFLGLHSLDISIPDGPLLKGVEGDVAIEFLGLPRSVGEQELRVASISSGNVKLENVQLLWSLPTIRHLQVKEFSARLGGGTVTMDPFSVDLFDPELVMQVNFKKLQAGLLMDWLGEDRFDVEGSLSGELDLRWRDGVLLVGEGVLSIDKSPTDNRFVFSDAKFLSDQFVNMKGVPEELKTPFLAALLQKGIRIDALALQLRSLPETGDVSLKLTVSGETVSEEIEVPIRGLVINNVIPQDTLAHLLGLFGSVRFLEKP